MKKHESYQARIQVSPPEKTRSRFHVNTSVATHRFVGLRLWWLRGSKTTWGQHEY